MANAFVRIIETFGEGAPGKCVIGISCVFTGSGLPPGQPFDGKKFLLNVEIASDYSLDDLKQGILSAVQALASEQGVTLLNSDVNMPAYEVGA